MEGGHACQRPWYAGLRQKALVTLTSDKWGPSSHNGATLDRKRLVAQLLGLFWVLVLFFAVFGSENPRSEFYVTPHCFDVVKSNVIQCFPSSASPAKPICPGQVWSVGCGPATSSPAPSFPRFSLLFPAFETDQELPRCTLERQHEAVHKSFTAQAKLSVRVWCHE